MRRFSGAVAVLLLAVCGADGRAVTPVAGPRPTAAVGAPTAAPAPTTASPTPKAAPTPVSTKAVERYLAGRPGRAAVFVRDLKTGRAFAYRAHERFITA